MIYVLPVLELLCVSVTGVFTRTFYVKQAFMWSV